MMSYVLINMITFGRIIANELHKCSTRRRYLFLGFANVLFQGLLNIHTLLDNPFGHHPTKFPLRAYVAQIIATTNVLAAGSFRPPMPFRHMFEMSDNSNDRSGAGDDSDSIHQRMRGNIKE